MCRPLGSDVVERLRLRTCGRNVLARHDLEFCSQNPGKSDLGDKSPRRIAPPKAGRAGKSRGFPRMRGAKVHRIVPHANRQKRHQAAQNSMASLNLTIQATRANKVRETERLTKKILRHPLTPHTATEGDGISNIESGNIEYRVSGEW